MTTWNLGACFTCTKCLLRSAQRACLRCGGATSDLRTETLETTWSAWRGFHEGWSLFSFRAVRATKVIRSLALLVTIGAVLAPVVGPLVREGHSPELLELVVGLGVGLLFAWPVFEFMSLYLLFIALVLRGMTRVFSFLFVSKITRVLSRALIPQLEVRRVEVIGGSPLRGVLTQPVTLHFVQDAWGFMERFDVHVFEPLRVKFEDGVEQSLELTHGALAIEPALQTPGSQVPTWLTVPKRDGVRFHRELPTGTRFVLTRGDAVVMLRFS